MLESLLEIFSSPETYLSLLTLTALEIVLGIDNLIFISILTGKLPEHQRQKGFRIGLFGALVTRLALLSIIAWIVRLDQPLFSVFNLSFSGKSLILLAGGLFLLFKATKEIHGKLEGEEHGPDGSKAARATFQSVIIQVMLLDLVFSIDSVITAVGMARHVSVMVAANVIALAVMLMIGGFIGRFVERHPSVKILALSFLMMIGLVLVADGFGVHIPKGYVYFAMGFSVLVELLNIRSSSRKVAPVALHNTPHTPDTL